MVVFGVNVLKFIKYRSIYEVVAQKWSAKKVFFEISQNQQKITCVRAPFLMKLQAVVCSFIKKEALTQVLYLTLWNRYIPLNFTGEYTD